MRILCTVFCILLLTSQVFGQGGPFPKLPVPVEGDVQATICDGCFVPSTSVSCKDVVTSALNTVACSGAAGVDENKNLTCFGNLGKETWAQDFWLRQVKAAGDGESGNKCETRKWKHCARIVVCEPTEEVTIVNGVKFTQYICGPSAKRKNTKPKLDKYPSGDSCPDDEFPIGGDQPPVIDPDAPIGTGVGS